MSRQAFSPNNALDLLVVAFPKSFLSFGNFVAASGKKIESHETKLAKIRITYLQQLTYNFSNISRKHEQAIDLHEGLKMTAT
jgi:hypothetical protein